MRSFVMTMIVLGTLVPSVGRASDSIKTRGQASILRGKITDMSSTEVKIDTNPLPQTVKVIDIVYIHYDEDPDGINKARGLAKGGQYAEALQVLEGIDRKAVTRPEITQDLDYLTAYCTTQQALTGNATVKAAGNLMLAFIKDNHSSYHILEANELVGDLYMMAGASDQAAKYYATAASAPWPESELRVNVKRGNALLSAKKTTEAISAFQNVMDSTARGDEVPTYKNAALLGKATALAIGGQQPEAIKLVETVLQKASKSDTDVLGQAYLTLGNCHRAAGKPKDALLDYLHVDLMYFHNPSTHAEALAALTKVWQEVGRPDRAREAGSRLVRLYPNSRWAQGQ